jgi:Zn-dependent protease
LLLGGKVDSIWINLGGAVIDAWVPNRTHEIISILAGPAGSLLLLFLYNILPELSVCAAVQGLYNLLPIYPLDGGRIRKLLVHKSSRILFATSISTVLLASIAYFIRTHSPLNAKYLLFLAAAILFTVLRNNPCKEEKIRLQ